MKKYERGGVSKSPVEQKPNALSRNSTIRRQSLCLLNTNIGKNAKKAVAVIEEESSSMTQSLVTTYRSKSEQVSNSEDDDDDDDETSISIDLSAESFEIEK